MKCRKKKRCSEENHVPLFIFFTLPLFNYLQQLVILILLRDLLSSVKGQLGIISTCTDCSLKAGYLVFANGYIVLFFFPGNHARVQASFHCTVSSRSLGRTNRYRGNQDDGGYIVLIPNKNIKIKNNNTEVFQ